jgi:hypothetical protein
MPQGKQAVFLPLPRLALKGFALHFANNSYPIEGGYAAIAAPAPAAPISASATSLAARDCCRMLSVRARK